MTLVINSCYNFWNDFLNKIRLGVSNQKLLTKFIKLLGVFRILSKKLTEY